MVVSEFASATIKAKRLAREMERINHEARMDITKRDAGLEFAKRPRVTVLHAQEARNGNPPRLSQVTGSLKSSSKLSKVPYSKARH